MSILLEKLRKKTQNVLTVTKDESLIEQINALKKNLYVDTTLATLLHSNHFDHKWNPKVQNKIQEHIDKTSILCSLLIRSFFSTTNSLSCVVKTTFANTTFYQYDVLLKRRFAKNEQFKTS